MFVVGEVHLREALDRGQPRPLGDDEIGSLHPRRRSPASVEATVRRFAAGAKPDAATGRPASLSTCAGAGRLCATFSASRRDDPFPKTNSSKAFVEQEWKQDQSVGATPIERATARSPLRPAAAVATATIVHPRTDLRLLPLSAPNAAACSDETPYLDSLLAPTLKPGDVVVSDNLPVHRQRTYNAATALTSIKNSSRTRRSTMSSVLVG